MRCSIWMSSSDCLESSFMAVTLTFRGPASGASEEGAARRTSQLGGGGGKGAERVSKRVRGQALLVCVGRSIEWCGKRGRDLRPTAAGLRVQAREVGLGWGGCSKLTGPVFGGPSDLAWFEDDVVEERDSVNLDLREGRGRQACKFTRKVD